MLKFTVAAQQPSIEVLRRMSWRGIFRHPTPSKTEREQSLGNCDVHCSMTGLLSKRGVIHAWRFMLYGGLNGCFAGFLYYPPVLYEGHNVLCVAFLVLDFSV